MKLPLVEEVVMRPVPGLEDLINDLPDGIDMIEIGSFAGESTEVFIRSGKIKKLIVVEPWDNDVYKPMNLKGSQVQLAFNNRMQKLIDEGIKMPELVIAKRFSADAAPLIEDGAYDFVYIDGEHSYDAVAEDIKNYTPKLKTNGILGGHDYYTEQHRDDKRLVHIFHDVKMAVDYYVGKPDNIYPDTSWIIDVKNIKETSNVK